MPKVSVANRVAGTADTIWQAIGQFGALADWHPMIERVETDGSGRGSTRTLHLVGGGKIVERLETIDEKARRYGYSIVEGPLPVSGYVSELAVKDNGDGTSTVEWTSSFEPTVPDANAVVKSIEDIYKAGLSNLQKMYGIQK